MESAEARIDDVRQTVAAEAESKNAALQTLTSKIDGVEAEVDSVKRTAAEQNRAQSERTDTLTARVDGAESSIRETRSAVAATDGKVNSLYTLKTEAVHGGRRVVSGLALGADGRTGDSQMLVYADSFAVVNPQSKAFDTPFVVHRTAGGAQMALKGDFIADGTITGRHLRANESLTSPHIQGGTLNASYINGSRINGGGIDIGNGNFTVDGGGNLYARSGRFEGTVYAEKLEGDVLKMYRMERVSEGLYRLQLPPASSPRIAQMLPVYLHQIGLLNRMQLFLRVNWEEILKLDGYEYTWTDYAEGRRGGGNEFRREFLIETYERGQRTKRESAEHYYVSRDWDVPPGPMTVEVEYWANIRRMPPSGRSLEIRVPKTWGRADLPRPPVIWVGRA
nr:DUF1983 domain-containing protein [Neisseria sp. 51.81]